MIIQALNRTQKERGGYLTQEDLRAVAKELQVPLHKIQELVTFYPHYRTSPPPCVEVHVCRDMACHLRGSTRAIDELQAWAHERYGEAVHVAGVSCLGRCDRAPAALVNEQLFVLKSDALVGSPDVSTQMERWSERLKQVVADKVATSQAGSPAPTSLDFPASDWDLAKHKIGTWQVDVYQGGKSSYRAVEEYLRNPNPARVLKVLERAGLLGMGGAGGRTYLKWQDVYEAHSTNGEKYVVCNADESEPGTFKDRDLLLITPHLTIEGMILAGLVVGATRGWVYIRHEYPGTSCRH